MWWERHCWTATSGRRGANKEEGVDASATPSLIALAAVAASVVGLRLSRASDVGNRGAPREMVKLQLTGKLQLASDLSRSLGKLAAR